MNWEEFQNAKRELCPSSQPPMLFQSGIQGDNRTVVDQVGDWWDNTKFALFSGKFQGRDFIWNGDKVRVMGDFQSGGHPALASFATVFCAGIIEDNCFFFHSGHYKPELKHALYFFCDFVEKSCKSLAGAERDKLVGELCNMTLRLYSKGASGRTYNTSFDDEAKAIVGGASYLAYGKTQPISIGTRSSPIAIGGRQPPLPVSRGPAPTPASEQTTGTTDTTKMLDLSLIPRWADDFEYSKCAVCKAVFSTVLRKHHCRKCGKVVCDECSKGRVALKDALVRPNGAPEKGPVRVCKICYPAGAA